MHNAKNTALQQTQLFFSYSKIILPHTKNTVHDLLRLTGNDETMLFAVMEPAVPMPVLVPESLR